LAAASWSVVSGRTHSTLVVMTSLTFMGGTSCLRTDLYSRGTQARIPILDVF
jgi:hypothetical protein